MAWRQDEIWFGMEVLWFGEAPDHGGAAALEPSAPGLRSLDTAELTAAIPNGLAESRLRRAERRRRRENRKTRAAAFVIGPAVALTLAGPRPVGASRAGEALERDPPSQPLRLQAAGLAPLWPDEARPATPVFPEVRWSNATSHGLQYGGSLSDGTQLPVEGPDWVTWNPVADRVPNRPHRLYGNDRVIRKLLAVAAAYREANPGAPRVVVGDISYRGGGPMELHVSHQNGLDVDVYYPRRDGALRAPTAAGQIDRELAQDLLDRFVAAGAQIVFVGYSTGLRGEKEVVVPYPNHEDHMHVRFGRR